MHSASYCELIEKVVVPYIKGTFEALGLDKNKKTLLKLDLPYSHKTPEVLAFCKANNICLLFVPAGCTDLIQE
jgi:hypothetical protein